MDLRKLISFKLNSLGGPPGWHTFCLELASLSVLIFQFAQIRRGPQGFTDICEPFCCYAAKGNRLRRRDLRLNGERDIFLRQHRV
jgi:hypothetical protein